MASQILVDRFKPVVWIDRSEPNNPFSVDNYLLAANVLDAPDGNIVLGGPLTSQILYDNQNSIPAGATLGIMETKEEEVKAGTTLSTVNSQCPLYCRINTTETNIYLTYMFSFGFNGNYPVLFGLFPTGAHWADFEHLTIELDLSGTTIQRVYFGAHSTENGKWMNPDKILYHDGRVLMFTARGSHAMYYWNRFYIRFGGFANDLVSEGKLWDSNDVILLYDPSEVDFDPATMGFLTFGGSWGNGKISGLQNKYFWDNPEAGGESASPWASRVNVSTQWILLVIVLVIIVGLSGWAIYEYGVKKPQQNNTPWTTTYVTENVTIDGISDVDLPTELLLV